MGDFVGATLKHAARKKVERVLIVGMIGKLSKMADGKMQTHAAGSEVSMDLLAGLAQELGGRPEVLEEIRKANTARHVLELCAREGLVGITSLICRRVVERAERHVSSQLAIEVALVDFSGGLLGRYPPDDDDAGEGGKRS
jgi:cobalt-precorrin-5B (C1)-methyltransferase